MHLCKGTDEMIDLARKICIVIYHPGGKNKDAARVGYPKCCDALGPDQ